MELIQFSELCLKMSLMPSFARILKRLKNMLPNVLLLTKKRVMNAVQNE